MKIDSVLSQAMTGIYRGMASAQRHASQIASADSFANGGPANLAEPLVGLSLDRLQVAASAQVLKAADDMIGTLFDEKV